MIKEIGWSLLGLVSSAILVIIGFVLTKLTGNGLFIGVSMLSVPLIGWYQYTINKKALAIGMFIASLPILYLGFVILVASGLH